MVDPRTPDSNSPKPEASSSKKGAPKKPLSKEEVIRRKKLLIAKKKKILAAKKAAEAKKAAQASGEPTTSFSDLVDSGTAPRRKPNFSDAEPASTESPQPAEATPQPRVKTPSRVRKPRTKTRSKASYADAQQRMSKRSIRQTLIFLAMGVVLMAGLAWYAQMNSEIGAIIQARDDGYGALGDSRFSEARIHFLEAYNLYRAGYQPTTELLWSTQSRLMPIMTDVAIGFAAVQDFTMSIETFREISIRINEPETSWTWITLREDFERLAARDFWTEGELVKLYLALASEEPDEWKLGALELVRITELTGMVMKPISVRYQTADIVLYGTIQETGDGLMSQLVLDAETIYKANLDYPSQQTVALAPRLRQVERDRIAWYAERQASVIIFARMGERVPVIDSLEGIVLSADHTVDVFNRAYEAAEADATSSLLDDPE